MGSWEQAVTELGSGAVSALVIKHGITIFSKSCNKQWYIKQHITVSMNLFLY